MTINATMGIKLPTSLWCELHDHVTALGLKPSNYINQIIVQFKANTLELLTASIQYALSQDTKSTSEESKSTSCSIDVDTLQYLHDTALKLEISREGILRLLIRYDLAMNPAPQV